MEEFRDYFNPIQYEYVYNVCKRLAPHLDEFDKYIKMDKKNIIILRSLTDALFDMDVFLDLLKRNSMIDSDNYNIDDIDGYLTKEKLPICEDEELIKRAYISFRSLFLAERSVFSSYGNMPSDILNNFVEYNQNDKMRAKLKKYFFDYLTSDDITFERFMNDYSDECDSIKRRYIYGERKKIEEMYMDEVLFNAISGTIYPYENMHIYINSLKDYLEKFFDNIYDNKYVLDFDREVLYDELKPSRRNYKKIEKCWSLDAIKYFYDYAYVPGIERMNLEDYLDYMFVNHKNEMLYVLNKVKIDPEGLIEIINHYKNKEMNKLDIIKKDSSIEEQLKRKLGEANAIKVPKFEYETSVNIYEYGEEELRRFTKIINEITLYATKNITSESALTDCINGVIPRLTIIDKLNFKKINKKMENRLDDTKANLTDIESNLKTQIMVYEYLMKVYEKRLEFINELELRINNEANNNNNEGFAKVGLDKKKENILINKSNTITMMAQVETLTRNHITILNMLYRTKETFFTVIEAQTLINTNIEQEKLALKNIRNIVDVYDKALSNDFVSAFSLIERLKSNGLDQTSALQLETNITNIQNLFSPCVMDEVNEIKPSTSNMEIETDENLTLPVGHVRD